jgi:hypothetical protein
VADDGFQITGHFGGRIAEDREASVFEPAIPHSIALRPFSTVVRLAIHSDDQAGGMAVEVSRICSGRVLLAELQAGGPLPQLLP